jgi:thiol-disulfide isomerase/thioredoxin/sirohydrochlorin ferrochelatase
VIEAGASLDGDRAVRTRIAAERQEPVRAYLAWERTHPYPGDNAPPEKRRAYAEALLAESARLLETPRKSLAYSEWLSALAMLDAPLHEVLRVADEFLAVSAEEDRPTNQEVSVATAFLQRGIYLDRVPALVEELVGRFNNDLVSIHSPPQARMSNVYQSVNALSLQVKAYEKLGQGEKAHQSIRQMQKLVALHRPPAEMTDSQALNFYALARGAMWISTAQLAESEGRKLDALSAYREVPPPLRAATLEPQSKLWKDLGGSLEAWSQWVAVLPIYRSKPAAADTWTGRLAPMSLKDFAGNVWTLEQLKGKTTIAVVWASWCAPCVAELPYFAKLADRVKGRDDVLAISFNVDENAFLAETFWKTHVYNFPALSAKQYAEDLMGDLTIPRTLIIKDGAITYEREGFGADGDKWVEEMLAKLK